MMFVLSNVFAQKESVIIKSWVKKNGVLLRWAPANMEVFKNGVKYGYKIARKKIDGTQTHTVVVKPLGKTDTTWFKLMKSDKNMSMVYSAMYNNQSKSGDIKKKTEQERMVFHLLLLSCDFKREVAEACGLFYEDHQIDNTVKYVYEVSVNLPTTLSNSGKYTVDATVLSINPEIKNLQGLFRNKSVKLKWNAQAFRNDYAGYVIERSADSINYIQLNNAPVILISSQFEKNKENIFYLDTFPETGKKYHYRIKGINHFGELSVSSNVISAIGYNSLKSFPVFDTLYVINNRKVFMHWRMSEKDENELPVKYFITRSISDQGKYQEIYNTKKQFEFIDENPLPTNFYKINAISLGGDTLSSFSQMALIIDTIPPVKPQGLKAKVDSKGIVTLTWNLNPENDVKGYKIFRSNALHEEFVQINNEFVKEAVYKDKLNLKTLTKKVYYRISAADNRFNNSEQSEIIEVKRPDTIAPVPAVVTKLQMLSNGIKIEWINSNSEDLKYSVLYRQKQKDMNQVKLMEWNVKDSLKMFVDSTLNAGEGYRYKIIASDEDDNISVSNNPYMLFETGFRKKITDVKFSVDRTLKKITLNWNYNEKGVEKYVIYRCKKGGALIIIKTLKGDVSSFVDTTASISNIYEYRIKPVFTNGAEGIISDVIEVEY